MFHVLTDSVCSSCYQIWGAIDKEVVALIGRVLDEIKYKTILKTYIHCGYFHSHDRLE
jgi:hypothetical protein